MTINCMPTILSLISSTCTYFPWTIKINLSKVCREKHFSEIRLTIEFIMQCLTMKYFGTMDCLTCLRINLCSTVTVFIQHYWYYSRQLTWFTTSSCLCLYTHAYNSLSLNNPHWLCGRWSWLSAYQCMLSIPSHIISNVCDYYYYLHFWFNLPSLLELLKFRQEELYGNCSRFLQARRLERIKGTCHVIHYLYETA